MAAAAVEQQLLSSQPNIVEVLGLLLCGLTACYYRGVERASKCFFSIETKPDTRVPSEKLEYFLRARDAHG